MPEVMDRLREEHRHIARLLTALERQLAIFDAGERPDYDVLTAIADYFVGFPDRCHHPKEDLIYRKMCERDPATADATMDLLAEHETISGHARHFRDAVHNVLNEIEVPRGAFHDAAANFIAEQRRHLQAEEQHFFPRALELLTPADWAEIDRQVVDEQDPLFGGAVSQDFAALRDDILRWQAEDEARQD